MIKQYNNYVYLDIGQFLLVIKLFKNKMYNQYYKPIGKYIN